MLTPGEACFNSLKVLLAITHRPHLPQQSQLLQVLPRPWNRNTHFPSFKSLHGNPPLSFKCPAPGWGSAGLVGTGRLRAAIPGLAQWEGSTKELMGDLLPSSKQHFLILPLGERKGISHLKPSNGPITTKHSSTQDLVPLLTSQHLPTEPLYPL